MALGKLGEAKGGKARAEALSPRKQISRKALEARWGGKEMINQDELTICKRRGHDARGLALDSDWVQCKWCGTWLRQVKTIEERDDAPPKEEQSRLGRLLGEDSN